MLLLWYVEKIPDYPALNAIENHEKVDEMQPFHDFPATNLICLA